MKNKKQASMTACYTSFEIKQAVLVAYSPNSGFPGG